MYTGYDYNISNHFIGLQTCAQPYMPYLELHEHSSAHHSLPFTRPMQEYQLRWPLMGYIIEGNNTAPLNTSGHTDKLWLIDDIIIKSSIIIA